MDLGCWGIQAVVQALLAEVYVEQVWKEREGEAGLAGKVLGVWGGARVEASEPGRDRWEGGTRGCVHLRRRRALVYAQLPITEQRPERPFVP